MTSDRHRIGTFYNNIIIIIFDRVYKLVHGDGFFFLSTFQRVILILYYFIIRDHDRLVRRWCGLLTGGGYNVWAGRRPHEHCGGKRNGLHSTLLL